MCQYSVPSTLAQPKKNLTKVHPHISATKWMVAKDEFEMLGHTQAYILHTKAYCMVCAKHLSYKSDYIATLWSSTEFTLHERADVGHSCIIFHIVRTGEWFWRTMHRLSVPQIASVADTNIMGHSKSCTHRCTLDQYLILDILPSPIIHH